MAPSCRRRGERQRLAHGGSRHNLPLVLSRTRLVCGLGVASKGSQLQPLRWPTHPLYSWGN